MTLPRAAELLGLSARHVRRRCQSDWARRGLAELRPPPNGRGKPTWWVDPRADKALFNCPDRVTRDQRARELLLSKYPAHIVDRAYRKAFWLRVWRGRCNHPRPSGQTERSIAAGVVAEAKRTEGADFRISVRALQIWNSSASNLDTTGQVGGVAALCDRYSPPRWGGGGRGEAARSSAAIDFFYALYHTQAKHSVKTCHTATLAEAGRRGWQWPPGYAATLRWLRTTEDRATSCLHREGRTAYSKRYMQHLELDYTALPVAERYVLDHSQADYWCTYRDGQVRPWVTAILDARSRCITGWHMGPTPHQDSILAAMRMAFRDWAVPAGVHIDQGKDFTSRLLTGCTKAERVRHRRELGPDWRNTLTHQHDVFWHGVLGELGIEISEAIPYHPWAKGQIERWFATMHDQFDKLQPTYTGRSTETRPECSQVMRSDPDVPTLDECRDRFAGYIDLYHRTVHSALEGLSPIAIWNTATSLRRAVDDDLMALMQSRGVYRVGANGVRLTVGNTALTYGAASAALRSHAGRDVFITLDPAHCEHCYAYTPDRARRVLIGRLECNQRLPANTGMEELREAIRDLRSRNKHFDRAQREAPKRMRNAAQEVRAHRTEQLAELRATGTDHAAPIPTIIPVRTGFEECGIVNAECGKRGSVPGGMAKRSAAMTSTATGMERAEDDDDVLLTNDDYTPEDPYDPNRDRKGADDGDDNGDGNGDDNGDDNGDGNGDGDGDYDVVVATSPPLRGGVGGGTEPPDALEDLL